MSYSAPNPSLLGNNDHYWATGAPDEIAKEGWRRVENWRDWLRLTGETDNIARAYAEFYSTNKMGTGQGSQVQKAGEGGKNVRVRMGRGASLARGVRSLIIQNAPDVEVAVDNTAVQPMAAAEALRMFIRSQLRKGGQRDLEQQVTLALLHKVAWIGVGSDETGQRPESEVIGGYHVAQDPRVPAHKAEWVIVTRRVNRWQLMAQPGLAQDVLDGIRTAPASPVPPYLESSKGDSLTDQIDVHTLYHAITPAVPQGLMLSFLDTGLVYFGPGEWWNQKPGRLPWWPLVCEPHDESPLGDSPFIRILGMSEAYDELQSRFLTAALATAKPVVIYPDTVDWGTKQLQADGVPALAVTRAEADIFKVFPMGGLPKDNVDWAASLPSSMEQAIGSNPVVQGQPPPNVAAGNFAALMVETAVKTYHFASVEHATAISEYGNLLIEWLQTHMQGEAVYEAVGEDNLWRLETMLESDVKAFQSCYTKPVPPGQYSRQTALTMAGQLMQAGQIDVQTYFSIITTGSADLATSLADRQLMNVRLENSLIRRSVLAPPPPPPAPIGPGAPPPGPMGPPPGPDAGPMPGMDAGGPPPPPGAPGPGPQPGVPPVGAPPGPPGAPPGPPPPSFLTPQPQALITDDHPFHIKHHKAELDSPDARANPHVVESAMQHIQQHVMLGNLPPEACVALGLPPTMSPMFAAQQAAAGPAGTPPGAPPEEGASKPGAPPAQPAPDKPLPEPAAPPGQPQ